MRAAYCVRFHQYSAKLSRNTGAAQSPVASEVDDYLNYLYIHKYEGSSRSVGRYIQMYMDGFRKSG